MTTIIGDISMSLDGFVTAVGAHDEDGLGVDGDALHAWALDPTDADRAVLDHLTDRTGAVVMGRRTFDVVDGPHGWTDEMGYGADAATTPPLFVLTSTIPASVRLTHEITFVLEGPAAAVTEAAAAAGGKDVFVMGGAAAVRACLESDVLDELRIHLAPIVLGGGTALFTGVGRHDLVQRDVVVTPRATHLTYDVTRRTAANA